MLNESPLYADYRILGISSGASVEEIKDAYHQAAKKNHPDLHPEERRGMQQLAMMRINEAYLSIMAAHSTVSTGAETTEPGESGRAPVETPPERGAEETPDTRAVGRLKDPAYTYYKLGFNAFQSGYTELFHKDPREIRRQLRELRTADAYILSLAVRALRHFETAYRYFLTVVQEYPQSIWVHDARWKLRRVENFSQIYQRICDRLTHDLARNRKADPAAD
ncbi:MAG TPA: DnaJ domain-containing protein [Spirochaetia bacterium]|nr:DnaJ domain-containing protein [Spirochaetia bacterium]